MSRLKFGLRRLFVVQFVVAALLAFGWWWPKTRTFDNGFSCVVYYRGWGLIDDASFLGCHDYKIVAIDKDDGSSLSASLNHPGFNDVKGYYKDGSVREVGEYWVTLGYRPQVDHNHVRWGKYYLPNGIVGGEIVEGTGHQRYWSSSATMIWEATFHNYYCAHLSTWHPNGVLSTSVEFKQDMMHGEYKSYHSNGQLMSVGNYTRGEKSGRWTYYNDDGMLEREECFQQ